MSAVVKRKASFLCRSLFEDKDIHSLGERDKVGLYYILSYIFFNLPERVEDGRIIDFERMVKSDLEHLLGYLFSSYKLAYAAWLRFHISDPKYLASDMLYAASFNKEYKLSYVRKEEPREHILVDYSSPSFDIKELYYDYSSPFAKAVFNYFQEAVRRWGDFMHGKVMPIADKDPFLAHSALAVAYHISPEDGDDHSTDYKVAEDDRLFINARGASNYISYDTYTAPELTPLVLIKNTYDDYLRGNKWQGKDLGHKIAIMNLLINAQHHSGKMGSFIVTGSDNSEWLTDEYLTALSDMHWLPKVSDIASSSEKFLALRRLYDSWQVHLPWNR